MDGWGVLASCGCGANSYITPKLKVGTIKQRLSSYPTTGCCLHGLVFFAIAAVCVVCHVVMPVLMEHKNHSLSLFSRA